MKTALLAATAIVALWDSPAGATLLCPDETGMYTPGACDLILPIEPSPGARECSIMDEIVWSQTGQSSDPVCVDYWEREDARRARLLELQRKLQRIEK